jgi:Ca2+-binding EF-hand superfamily protein
MKQLAALATASLLACAPHPGPVKRQMMGLLEKFDRWDYNGDGQLVASELGDAEMRSGLPVVEIIDFYDTGKDGMISFAEAQAGISRLDEARETVKKLQS